ncbi:MAG: Holliday junction resolvase RuvX [Kineosporiaceae bacterium]
METPSGAVLAVDVGRVRSGVAVSDPARSVATPLATVPGDAGSDPAALARVVAGLVTEHAATSVVVGLPLSLSGAEGPAAALARGVAGALAAVVDVPVRLVDERFTTTTAHDRLRAAGRSERRRRPVVDQEAATVLLQHVLDAARGGVELGRPPTEGVGAA